ncbi:helicase-associated domain-containing protein [Georgenia sp. AZ-5]|uniref:helicase-associated domain-containing protein n=1 Tax=Georgenia sp. AZ-5 TaxID=3367526 RepID=UPI0037551E3E
MTAGTTPRAAAATGEVLAAALARRADEGIAALLRARPDLAAPPPSSLTALAARAGSRPSVERALSGLDGVELAVAEAAVALAPVRRPTPAALSKAVGVDAAPAHARLHELALLVRDLPVAALVEALGPHPAGLGPTLAELDRHAPAAAPAEAAPAEAAPPTTAAALRAVLKDAPASAAGTLDALTWGPPVGTVGDDVPEGAAWLLGRGILRRLSPTQLVLPREVALAARGGRTHREPPTPPAAEDVRTYPAAVVEAESARAAEEMVRLVAALLRAWHQAPASVLRTGGIGVRELRRTAAALEVSEADAALVAELAAMSGLLTQDDDETVAWSPSRAALDWLEDPLPARWAHLARAWFSSARTPWLVGTRSDQGTLRAALEPTLERGWAVELRERALRVLADLPPGAGPSPAQVHELLTWRRPRATAPERTVAAVLAEAGRLGLTGAGALAPAGRAVLAGAPADEVAAALEATLPEPVGELLVQGDLTAVVPGRPEPALAELLSLCTEVESRGAALTVRFTAESVRRALDAGTGADELLAALAERCRTPLPQPLEYLVRDVARRHGQVRVGTAGAYLRLDDAAGAATLVGDPALARLGLRAIAPTVLVSPADPGEVLDVLHEAGLAPVLEGPDGAVVLTGLGAGPRAATRVRQVGVRGRRGVARGLPTFPGAAASTYTRRPDDADLRAVVGRMRAGEARARRDAAARRDGAPAATDPVHALVLLREAATAGTPVEMVLVGPTGRPERRRVQPVHVDGGRVRVTDLDRQTELTVAVHRISAVAPA